jgi:hydrogenase-4 component E
MKLDAYEAIAISSAVTAIFMLGSSHLRQNLWFYAFNTVLIGALTGLAATVKHESHLLFIALAICVLKAVGIPIFLNWIIKRINVEKDPGTFLAAPLAMHLSILLMGGSYLLAAQLPGLVTDGDSRFGATAAMSLLFTGVLLMLTRKFALSQILGFLVIENGIYMFALTQTQGMPMIVEMGVLLDVLVGVMIAGLITFRIKKSFEHIDVSQLTELTD